MNVIQQKKYTQLLRSCGHDELPEVTFTSEERSVIALTEPSDDNPRVQDISMLGLKALAAKMYQRANARYGNAAKPEDETVQNIDFLVGDLLKHPLLRVKEVSEILDRGLDGKFDAEDVRHFSSSRFAKWITAYIESKKAVMKKKAQYDHQQLAPLTPTEQEEKRILEEGFGWWIRQVENDDLPKFFHGLDDVFVRWEELSIIDALSIEEKNIIAEASAKAVNLEGEALKVFARKVAFLYVLHQSAMKEYTLEHLIAYVKKNDKLMSAYLQDVAHQRLDEYEKYKQTQNAIIDRESH